MNNVNNYTITVIDDEEQIRQVLDKKLSQLGYNIIPFEEAEDLVSLLKKEETNIDLVITDIKLKRMDGIELLRQVKAMNDTIPVLLITGQGDIEDAIQALRYGASDFIRKPFDLNEITSSVNSILRVKREEQLSEKAAQYMMYEKRHFEIPIDTTICNVISYLLTKDLTPSGLFNRATSQNILLALREAIDNAMIHGNLEITSEIIENEGLKMFYQKVDDRKNNEKYINRKVTIYYELDTDFVEYIVEDEGPGFDYNILPDPRDPENFFKNSGRGLLIIRTLMDEVDWNDKGNMIRLRKYATEKERQIQQLTQEFNEKICFEQS